MTGHHFTIFDTAIGRCGIVWGERGITSVQLPMGDEKKTRTRLQQRHDDLIEAPPPANVQSAIAGIVELLEGKPNDLADVVLDLDGVVYVGPDAVPGVPAYLDEARAAGMRLGFVTNNASREPESVAEQLTGLDIPTTPDEVMTAAQAAAALLRTRLEPGARVLVVGGAGLLTAVREAGFVVVKWPLRWTAITASHSSSVMLKTIRSRRIPATLTTMSRRPNSSSACFTIRSPPSIVATVSKLGTALPPAARISSATSAAGPSLGWVPSTATP